MSQRSLRLEATATAVNTYWNRTAMTPASPSTTPAYAALADSRSPNCSAASLARCSRSVCRPCLHTSRGPKHMKWHNPLNWRPPIATRCRCEGASACSRSLRPQSKCRPERATRHYARRRPQLGVLIAKVCRWAPSESCSGTTSATASGVIRPSFGWLLGRRRGR